MPGQGNNRETRDRSRRAYIIHIIFGRSFPDDNQGCIIPGT